MNKSLIAIAIAMALGAGSAQAERLVHRQSLTLDKTRVTNQGSFTRHTEQNVTANGYTRATEKMNAAGEIATRNRAVVNDAATGTRTSTVSGTTFNGKAYAGESVQVKTAEGFSSSGSFTGPNGNTSTHAATVSMDKENGTFSKDVTVTGPRGGTTTQSVDASLDRANGTLTKEISVTAPNGEMRNTTVVKTTGTADGGAE